jgi:hypothetical protein
LRKIKTKQPRPVHRTGLFVDNQNRTTASGVFTLPNNNTAYNFRMIKHGRKGSSLKRLDKSNNKKPRRRTDQRRKAATLSRVSSTNVEICDFFNVQKCYWSGQRFQIKKQAPLGQSSPLLIEIGATKPNTNN